MCVCVCACVRACISIHELQLCLFGILVLLSPLYVCGYGLDVSEAPSYPTPHYLKLGI